MNIEKGKQQVESIQKQAENILSEAIQGVKPIAESEAALYKLAEKLMEAGNQIGENIAEVQRSSDEILKSLRNLNAALAEMEIGDQLNDLLQSSGISSILNKWLNNN
jgi:hypothetical protein